MIDLRNHAISYAQDKSWSVFPTHGVEDGRCTCGNEACKSPGKHPTTPQGLKNATKDVRLIGMLFKPGLNLAVATGEASGFWVLDIDGQAGEQSLAGLEAQHGGLPATLVHYTGNGRHLLFRWPGYQVKNSVKRLGDGLDVRGDGGYIVAAPSRHVSGVEYRFADATAAIADAPQWLLDAVKREATPVSAPTSATYVGSYVDQELTADQVHAMLERIHPDCDYQSWIEIGMGLHAGGWPVQMWDDWSRAGAKYQAGDCYKRWRGFKPGQGISFGTVWHHAEAAGWTPAELDAGRAMPAGPHPAAGFLAKVRSTPRPATPAPPAPIGAFPFDPLQLTGVIGDTVRWVVNSAIKPQPEFALLNTLTTLGAVFGRRYATPWDTRTNLYMVSIANTGAGKDHSRQQLKKLMLAAGMHDFLGGDSIVSGPGMLRAVEANPAQVMNLDEFGILLKAITSETGNAHLKSAGKAFMELFSSAASMYHGGQYASPDIKPIIIDRPNLCIYATSTLEKYVEALSRSAIASGELNRFLVFRGRDDVRRSRNIGDREPDARLVADWTAYRKHMADGQGNLQAIGGKNIAAPKPIVVRWDSVEERIHDIGEAEDDRVRKFAKQGLGGIWSRYTEQVIKLAMIAAIARNPLVPIMEDSDLDFGEQLVTHSCQFVATLARENIADSRQEREVNLVLDFVRRAGPGGVTKTDLARGLRALTAKQRGEILSDLATVQGEIEIVPQPAERGPGALVYRYVGC